ncbi:MAG: hypothetical protein ACQES9_10300 [Myxococcota bacterium]
MPTMLAKLKYLKNIFPRGTVKSQSGFSMIVVFLIMISMVGAATSMLVSTRSNVRNVGQNREKVVSRYVAEAAVAQAKSVMNSNWSSFNKWTTLLNSPPSPAGTYVDYTYGGASTGLPEVKSRLLFTYSNNPDDPSLDPNIDNDGKVIIRGRGEILDPGSSTPIVLAVTVIEVQVYREEGIPSTYGYSAQSHAGTDQASYTSKDINAVDFSNSFSF